MNTELSLTDNAGVVISVGVRDLTPMGFECILAGEAIDALRDASGRFRDFDLVVSGSGEPECIGHCRVHSVRRICADKSAICIRFEGAAGPAYQRLNDGCFVSGHADGVAKGRSMAMAEDASYQPMLRRA
ncbi:MAG: hypothetical protein VW258_06880 [Thalassolituus sp.]